MSDTLQERLKTSVEQFIDIASLLSVNTYNLFLIILKFPNLLLI